MYTLTVYGLMKDGNRQTIAIVKSSFVDFLRAAAEGIDKSGEVPGGMSDAGLPDFEKIECEHNLPSKEDLAQARENRVAKGEGRKAEDLSKGKTKKTKKTKPDSEVPEGGGDADPVNV